MTSLATHIEDSEPDISDEAKSESDSEYGGDSRSERADARLSHTCESAPTLELANAAAQLCAEIVDIKILHQCYGQYQWSTDALPYRSSVYGITTYNQDGQAASIIRCGEVPTIKWSLSKYEGVGCGGEAPAGNVTSEEKDIQNKRRTRRRCSKELGTSNIFRRIFQCRQ